MARQKLGQHFLDSPAWQQRILEKLPAAPDDTWVEIGAGRGQITRHLARKAKRLVAVEADPRLAENLRGQIAQNPADWPNVEIAEGDVLSLDIAALASTDSFRVFGNLPYYITSPILHHLFQWADRIASIHIVIQLEVAERIIAKPGTRDRGYLSVACQYFTRPSLALKIPPGAFRPPPNVDSALIAMTLPGEKSALAISGGIPVGSSGCIRDPFLDDAAFLRFVQICFAHKRKTLRNNLLALAPDDQVRKAINQAGLPPTIRAEQLSLTDFAVLSQRFSAGAEPEG